MNCVICEDENILCADLIKKYDYNFRLMDESICKKHQETLMKLMFSGNDKN